jgi:threonine dehydratase
MPSSSSILRHYLHFIKPIAPRILNTAGEANPVCAVPHRAIILVRNPRVSMPLLFVSTSHRITRDLPMSFAVTPQEIAQAQQRIRANIFRTPLRESFLLSERIGARVFLKLENWQIGGSFKLRGALNRMMEMSDGERARGIVTASAGNHAQGVAYAARMLGISPATIFVPLTTPRAKLDKLREFPVTVRTVGQTYDDAHKAAEGYRSETGATFIHAYDDPRTVAGQGTIGLEILEDLPNVDAILVPVGGGGMIAGIAIGVKGKSPQTKIIGVQPAASPAMRDSLRDGRCYEDYAAGPTICDGLAGGIGKICFEVAQELVDDVVIVEEEETKIAIRALAEMQQLMVEGSGAVGVAALLSNKVNLAGKQVAVVISGANIDLDLFKGILSADVREIRYQELDAHRSHLKNT